MGVYILTTATKTCVCVFFFCRCVFVCANGLHTLTLLFSQTSFCFFVFRFFTFCFFFFDNLPTQGPIYTTHTHNVAFFFYKTVCLFKFNCLSLTCAACGGGIGAAAAGGEVLATNVGVSFDPVLGLTRPAAVGHLPSLGLARLTQSELVLC